MPSLEKSAKICLLNARSVCNKPSYIHDFTIDNDVDILCLTETWLKCKSVDNMLLELVLEVEELVFFIRNH